jgi:hypothetical protein
MQPQFRRVGALSHPIRFDRHFGATMLIPRLIAASILSIFASAHAQSLAPFSGATPVEVPEWVTRDEAGNCQLIPGTNQFTCRYFSGANASDITVLDGAANRPGLQMKRSGARFFGFPRNTPGTVEMRRFMFCSVSLDCSRPADTIYSHFIQPEKVYNDAGQLVDNPNFVYFRATAQSRYIEDQGYNGFNVVLPTRARIGNKIFQFCPTGTQEIRKWYNDAFRRSQTTVGYKNDGNWRFTQSFVWRDSALPRGYETSYDDELFCGPSIAKALWSNSARPADRQVFADGARGSFVTRTDLATATRNNYSVLEPTWTGTFDQSRNAYWTPSLTDQRIVRITNATTNNLIDSSYLGRILTNQVDQRSGSVLQFHTAAQGNRVWFLNRAQPTDSTPTIFIGAQGDGTALIEATVAGRVENDVLFRVLAVNNFTGARVEAWDLRTGTRIVNYPLNVRITTAANSNWYRPEISYNPNSNRLYVNAVEFGKLYYVDLDNGDAREILLPVEAFKPRDIEIDSARNVAYLAMRASSASGNAIDDVDNANSKLYELSLSTNSVGRAAALGRGAWQIALGQVNGVTQVFVTNAADGAGTTEDSVSQISVLNLTQVRKLPLPNQPTGVVVELLD